MKNLITKKLIFLLLMGVFYLTTNAQPIFVENFEYPTGSLLVNNGWTAHSGAGTNSTTVTDGLSFTGYSSSGIGGAAAVINNGEDVHRTFPEVTEGTVYVAFVIKTESTNFSGYFLHLGQTVISTTFFTRVWVNATGDGIGIGSTAPTTFTPISPGTPTLIVAKLDISSKISSLYTFNSFPTAEPSQPNLTFSETATFANVGSVALRQFNAAQRIIVDGIRIATSWNDALGSSTSPDDPEITITPTVLSGFTYVVGEGPSAEQNFTVSGSNLDGNISLVPPSNYEISVGTGASFVAANPLIINQTSGNVPSTPVYVRLKAGLSSGNYANEIITASSLNAVNKNVVCNGNVTMPVSGNIITQWNFNGPSADEIPGGTTSPLPSVGVGTADLTGGTTATYASGVASGGSSDPVITSPPNFAWNTTTYPAQGESPKTAGAHFLVNTTGFENIIFRFDQRLSNTAANTWMVQYTLNATATSPVWVDAQLFTFEPQPTGTGDTWFNLRNVDFSSVTGLSNNPNAGFRVVSDFDPVAGQYVAARSTSSYAGGTNRFDMVTIEGEPLSGTTATKLAITSVNGGVTPNINQPFSLTVQAQDENGISTGVTANTTVTLTKATGTGVLSGTLTGIIQSGEHTYTFSNLLYNVAESGVSITATATSGMTLLPATSSLFVVGSPATQLAFVSVPAGGQVGAILPAFSVEARRPDNTVDVNYAGQITLSKASGPGALTGTLTKNAINGVAFFNDISFDQAGNYTLNANASGLASALSSEITISSAPTITSEIVPQFIQGVAPSNNTRLPYAYWVSIGNLIPNKTYRYINQVVSSTDSPTTNGAGNVIFVNASGDFTRSTSPSFTDPLAYGTFTTSANGTFAGWFMTEATGNARFTPGNDVYFRIRLNDGNDGTTPVNWLTTTNSARVIDFGDNFLPNEGTAIRATSGDNPKSMVILYDNTAGTGNPIYATSVENTGIDFSVITSYAPFYSNFVSGVPGSWGGIIPNLNNQGIRLIKVQNPFTGSSKQYQSADGVWGTVDTRNPDGGLDNVLVLDLILIGIEEPTAIIGKIEIDNRFINLELMNDGQTKLEIYNVIGQPVISKEIYGSNHKIDHQLKAGTYIIRLSNDKGSLTRKFFVR
jgi:hypothetical protein